MEIKKLSIDMLRLICSKQMRLDFPADEIKPFSMIEQLYHKGVYSGYGFYENDTLLAYAFFCNTNDRKYILLDYLAVLQKHRSGGYGSRFLSMLREQLSDYNCLLLEVDDDNFAKTDAEQALRRRRIGFYLRNGVEKSPVRSVVYGCHFKIMYIPLAKPAGKQDVYDALASLYRTLFTPKQFMQNAEIYIVD